MRKAERLFQMTNLIRARQPIRAQDIALAMGVSLRSVYRYLDDLSVSGIPVYGTVGEGYRLKEGFALAPLNLSEMELEALMLGVNLVKQWAGHSLGEAATSVQHKIEAGLPEALQHHHSVIGVPPFYATPVDKVVWDKVYHAIKETRALGLKYQALDEAKTQRTIYPLGLFYWGDKWTLAAWCTLRKAYRNFRVDRIAHLEILSEKYTVDATVSLASYFDTLECEPEKYISH